VRAFVGSLDARQRLWLSGYLAGSLPAAATTEHEAAPEPAATILFGSQTGNSERVARAFGDELAARGIACELLDMLDCRKSHLERARSLYVVVSTQGDGVPPDRALPLYELLHSRKAPKLDHMRFSVLALGDSSYERFCETGRQFDLRLEALGAKRLRDCRQCDVEYESAARAWIEEAAAELAATAPRAKPHAVDHEHRIATVSIAYTRRNPFHAPLLANQRITTTRSTKDVRHVELALESSHIRYEPGDAIGIVPRNCTELVDAVLEAIRFAPDSPVTAESQTLPLRQALTDFYDLGPVNTAFVERYLQATSSEAAVTTTGMHLLDLVRAHPPSGLDAGRFIRLLRPLSPRLYSIASSQRVTPDEVHLAVHVIGYETLGLERHGVVSGHIGELESDDATLPIYLHRNTGFRLPSDPNTPIVMIGPGTGVAPFRAFVAERESLGAKGDNWLFFGDRSFDHDFLYQAEWLDWRKRGVLTRLDVAFSRDQADKVYVQHRMLAHGAAVWDWLQRGAHVYVCGDAQYMAPDVHAALLEIARRHGALSEDDAREYLTDLQRERRYQRDVY
jgi:sulfite reductase (NADPH) flavoprotein alpha-component